MNKAELAAKVAKKNDITKQEAINVIDATFDSIAETLIANEKITITGFGSLEPVTTSERVSRNPRTGEPVKVASKRKVR